MERRGERDGHTERLKDAFDSIISNSRFAVGEVDGCFFVRLLECSQEEPWRLIHNTRGSHAKAILALSQHHLDYAAIADGPDVLLFDFNERRNPQTLQSSGRVVTSLAWSHHDAEVIAIGYMDGIASVLGVGQDGSRERRLVSLGKGPIRSLSFSEAEEDCLSIVPRNGLFVWKLSASSGPPISIDLIQHNATDIFVWHPFVSSRALTASRDGVITTWDFSQTEHSRTQPNVADVLDDDGVSGRPEDMHEALSPTWRLFFKLQIRQADWMGKHGILILSKNGRDLSLYDARHAMSSSSSIWEYSLSHAIFHFRFADNNEGAVVASRKDGKMERLLFPPHILEMVDWSEYVRSRRSSSIGYGYYDPPDQTPADRQSVSGQRTSRRMDPTPISRMREMKIPFQKSPALRPSTPTSNFKASPKSPATVIQMSGMVPISPLKPAHSNQQQLASEASDIGSPMPFLSPTVPARRASPNSEITLPPISDSLYLDSRPATSPSLAPTIQQAESVETAPSIKGSNHDSDSDDDTFGEVLQSSGTLLPGAVNVPLPRSCSAAFAPNGKLVTFFPPRPKNATSTARNAISDQRSYKKPQMDKEDLFPSFGNLASDHLLSTSDGDNGLQMIQCSHLHQDGMPTFALIPPSFPEPPVWKAQPPSQFETTDKVNFIITLRDVDDIIPSRFRLAEKYQILCKEGAATTVCEHNASIARDSGDREKAEIWVVLGMLLDNEVPLELFTSSSPDVEAMAVVKRAVGFRNGALNLLLTDRFEGPSLSGKCSWNDHTLGGAWLLQKLFRWAEQRADIQMLAMMSAVLAEPSRQGDRRFDKSDFLTRLPTYQEFAVLPPPAMELDLIQSVGKRHSSVPVFRPGRRASNHVNTSPTKRLPDSSHVSSRNTSQPPTPFLDSTSSTPPFQFSMPPRQFSRLSAAGSASPENHRSSFSAAARYYAQSISDKFASYGTSPPAAKKLSVSPGNAGAVVLSGQSNELSSSFPTSAPIAGATASSWSKSVSFAFNSKESSFASARGVIEEDGSDYDNESDRTVEDGPSQPQTPKSYTGDIRIALKNEGCFADRICTSGAAAPSGLRFLTPELVVKGRLWQSWYAELLRAWGLEMAAAEMEKVAGITSENDVLPDANDHETGKEKGLRIVSDAIEGRHVCSICFCVVNRLEQVCPVCLHANHLTCWRDFMGNEGENDFECPGGCGCHCTLFEEK